MPQTSESQESESLWQPPPKPFPQTPMPNTTTYCIFPHPPHSPRMYTATTSMAPINPKKRKIGPPKSILKSSKPPTKKPRRQQEYHSSSSSASISGQEDFTPVNLAASDEDGGASSEADLLYTEAMVQTEEEGQKATKKRSRRSKDLANKASSDSSASDSDAASNSSQSSTSSTSLYSSSGPSTTSTNRTPVSKKTLKNRNNPAPFASSIATILSSNPEKKPTHKQQPKTSSTTEASSAPSTTHKTSETTTTDPILSRSHTTSSTLQSLSAATLHHRALRLQTTHRKQLLEKGRVKDPLLGTDDYLPSSLSSLPHASETDNLRPRYTAEEYRERETRLRKTAQRGVVRLFNAVRAAQKKGEEGERELLKGGGSGGGKGVVVGRGRREEKIGEMSREGWLEFLGGGAGGAGSGAGGGKGKTNGDGKEGEEVVGDI